MKAVPIALAAALLTTSAAASAQSATDARCIVLSSAFGKESSDTNAQKLAEATFYFYLGRIGATTTAAQLKALVDQQTKTITEAAAPGLMNDCVKGFQTKMQLIQSLAPKEPTPPPKK